MHEAAQNDTAIHPLKTEAISELEIIQRAKQGEAAAFEQLYRLHNRRVYALCVRMVGNGGEADDLTQDAFLQAFRKIHTFRGESAFSTWLHRLTVNVVLMRLRKRGLVETSLEEVTDPDEETGRPHKEFGGIDLRLSGSVDRVAIERALERLPVGYRKIFVLHDVHGYEHHEIAEILGCSAGNSKSQLHKARLRLRQFLKDDLIRAAHRKYTGKYSKKYPDEKKSQKEAPSIEIEEAANLELVAAD